MTQPQNTPDNNKNSVHDEMQSILAYLELMPKINLILPEKLSSMADTSLEENYITFLSGTSQVDNSLEEAGYAIIQPNS